MRDAFCGARLLGLVKVALHVMRAALVLADIFVMALGSVGSLHVGFKRVAVGFTHQFSRTDAQLIELIVGSGWMTGISRRSRFAKIGASFQAGAPSNSPGYSQVALSK